MTDNLKRETVVAVIVIGFVVTLFNIYTNPVIVEADEDRVKPYGGIGVIFDLSSGMRFNVSKLGDGCLSYMEGYMYRVRYGNESMQPFIALSWSEPEALNYTEAIHRGLNYTAMGDTVYLLGAPHESTIAGHVFFYQEFKRTSADGEYTGIVGFWNCSNSGRTLTLLVEQSTGSEDPALLDVFNQIRLTLKCHYPGQGQGDEESVGEIELPFDVDTLINVVLMIIMTVGFIFTYMMEGFPNFAHTSYAVIGAMVSFYLTRFSGFNPYDTWPFAVLVGGLIGFALYLGIVRPIRRNRGYQEITLTFTFIVVAMVLPQFAYIFNYWARYIGGAASRGYNLRSYDFSYGGIPGIAIISTATCILLILCLRYFLTRDNTGLSLRAVAENEALAATMGINTERAHCISWFISGALSALVGSIMTMYRGMAISGTEAMIVSVMSGAILGGVNNIYGAIIGGLFVALAQDWLRKFFYIFVGLAVEKWQGLLPMMFLVSALIFFPNGILGSEGLSIERARLVVERLRKRVFSE